jgi:hypothetical protein
LKTSTPGTDTEVISPLNNDASGDTISNNIFFIVKGLSLKFKVAIEP